MKPAREILISKRYSEAWDALSSGYLEKAYGIIRSTSVRSTDKQFRKKLLDELYWFQRHEYSELKNISDKTKYEFALVTTWNHLLTEKSSQDSWAFREILSPFIGTPYQLDIDLNSINKLLRNGDEFLDHHIEQQHQVFLSELSGINNLSLLARSLFVRIVNYGQVISGGLSNLRVIGPAETVEIKKALAELTQRNLIINELPLSDLLMNRTLRDLKIFAFENGIDTHGPKHQIIQAIISKMHEEKVEHWLYKHDKSSYVRPLIKDFQLLKKYFYGASGELFLYLRWLKETKYQGKSNETILSEKQAQTNIYNYRPLEPYRRFARNRKRVKNVKKTKKMQTVSEMWDAECDEFLLITAEKYAWDLELNIIDAINSQPPSRRIVEIKKFCNNDLNLIDFCYKKLQDLGVDVHNPRLLTCEGCGINYFGWSIEKGIAERVGYQICFCKQCYIKAFWGSRDATTDKGKMLEHLYNVGNILGTVPIGSFRNRKLSLSNLSIEKQISIVKTLIDMPIYKEYVEKFGSWLQALILAGILENDTQRTGRGIRSIANDGHVCNSLAERTIDDWLSAHQVQHEKEPKYPYHIYLNTTNMRADWRVKDIMVEYAGLMDEPSYAAKIKAKRELANEFHLRIIVIEHQDMVDLDKKLKPLAEE